MVHLRLIQLQMNTQVNVTKANINGVHPSSVLTFKSNLLLRNRSGNSGIVTFICFWYQIDLIHFDNISVSFITSSRKIECAQWAFWIACSYLFQVSTSKFFSFSLLKTLIGSLGTKNTQILGYFYFPEKIVNFQSWPIRPFYYVNWHISEITVPDNSE